jgi:hypothetical protein
MGTGAAGLAERSVMLAPSVRDELDAVVLQHVATDGVPTTIEKDVWWHIHEQLMAGHGVYAEASLRQTLARIAERAKHKPEVEGMGSRAEHIEAFLALLFMVEAAQWARRNR